MLDVAVASEKALEKKIVATFLFLLLLFTADSVFAAADQDISATARIDYVISGVPGFNEDTAVFKEDRLINFVVAESNGGSAVPVISGMTNAIMQFTVTNTGNGVQDFLLLAVNSAPNPFGLPADNFDPVGNLQTFVESSTPGNGYLVADDTAIFIDDLLPNETRIVYVLADMPAVALGDVASVSLIAQIAIGGVAGEGAGINNDNNARTSPAGNGYSNGGTNVLAGTAVSGPDTLATETVFNDPAGADPEDRSSDGVQDVIGNGQHSDTGAYQVMSPVNIVKTATVIDTQGGSDPHPGATLRYQLEVTISGNVAVDNLVITDVIPANTTYVDESIRLNGAVQTDADNTVVDFSKANTLPVKPIVSIEVDLSENNSIAVSPSTTNTIIFEVTID